MVENVFEIPEKAQRKYLERRQKDFDLLSEALKRGAFEEFERLGHQIKGNASSYGHLELEKIALQMEAVGKNRDIPGANRVLQELNRWLLSQQTQS